MRESTGSTESCGSAEPPIAPASAIEHAASGSVQGACTAADTNSDTGSDADAG